MTARTEALFRAFVDNVKDSNDAEMLAEVNDERGAGLAIYDCRCGALKCAGLSLAVLDGEGNAAMFALTPELALTIGTALMKVGAS